MLGFKLGRINPSHTEVEGLDRSFQSCWVICYFLVVNGEDGNIVYILYKRTLCPNSLLRISKVGLGELGFSHVGASKILYGTPFP